MGDLVNEFVQGASIDSYVDLAYREMVNSWTPTKPVNLYSAIFSKAVQHFGLDSSHTVLDVGSGNGLAVISGLAKYNEEQLKANPNFKPLSPQIVGLEPIPDFSGFDAGPNFKLVQGYGEWMPFHKNTFDLTILSRVLYRSSDPLSMLMQAIHVTKPGGGILIASNGINHALGRYDYEADANRHTFRKLHLPLRPFNPPANNLYLEEVPHFVNLAGGILKIKETNHKEGIVIDEPVIVTEERLPYFLDTIAFSVKRADLPTNRGYPFWHRYTYRTIGSQILSEMVTQENGEKAYLDRVVRGVYSFENGKRN